MPSQAKAEPAQGADMQELPPGKAVTQGPRRAENPEHAASPMRWRGDLLTLAYMALAAVVPYSYFSFLAAEQIAEHDRLRTQYAFESMEGRLPAPKQHAVTILSKETDEQLTNLEKAVRDQSDGFRVVMLQHLHQESVRDFIASPGFGIGRRNPHARCRAQRRAVRHVPRRRAGRPARGVFVQVAARALIASAPAAPMFRSRPSSPRAGNPFVAPLSCQNGANHIA
jgi:hypothetical protein